MFSNVLLSLKNRQAGLVSSSRLFPLFWIKLQIMSSELFYVIIIGSGIGGLVTATQLAAKGAKVIVFESYLIPGGSAGYFQTHILHFNK